MRNGGNRATGANPALPRVLITTFVDGFATAVAVLSRAVRPDTWRRPVRTEFARILDDAVAGCLPMLIGIALLVGLGVVAQALFWASQVGDDIDIQGLIAQIMIRELAPLAAALLLIGRTGLRLLSELIEMRRDGSLRQLDRQGVDPFLLLIVPRVLALPAALFCHAIIFIVVALVTGFVVAGAVGAITETFGTFAVQALASLGRQGGLVLPVKTLAIGFVVGVVLCMTGLVSPRRDRHMAEMLSRGFGYMLVAALVTNVLLSLGL